MLLKASQPMASIARFAAVIGLIAAHPAVAGNSIVSAIGIVESANCEEQSIKILGVTFAANDAGNAAAICGAEGSAGLSYVSAIGTTTSNGSIILTRLTRLSSGDYVPGATPVYLTGSISESRVEFGEAVLSGAVISLGTVDLQFGNVVEVLGTQPVIGGVILPTTVRVVDSVVDDYSVDSGTGTRSSIGSGTSTFSSIGSGSSTRSSIGSGTSTNSSIGSGISTRSSIGSGRTSNSSIGSGTNANSSLGSGASANSSIGSGVATNSSIGSGVSTYSSIGSGSH